MVRIGNVIDLLKVYESKIGKYKVEFCLFYGNKKV